MPAGPIGNQNQSTGTMLGQEDVGLFESYSLEEKSESSTASA